MNALIGETQINETLAEREAVHTGFISLEGNPGKKRWEWIVNE